MFLLRKKETFVEKVSKTREKVKCQEAEEMAALEEQVILLTVPVLMFVAITAGLNVERENTNLHMQRKLKVSGPVV